MVDEFLTLKGDSKGYYMEKGSKFLAFATPIQNEPESLLFLQKIKKDHPKARHYCTAFRLFPDASIERSNDDGEPSGSAGRPILNQLVKNNLTNVMIVVVRYFGGTKLGIPGLIEAYKTSALNAIEEGIVIHKKVFAAVRLEMSYEHQPSFMNYCKQTNIPVFEEGFSERAIMVLGFRKSNMMNGLIESMHQFSHMDFTTLEEYLQYLGMSVEIHPEDRIL